MRAATSLALVLWLCGCQCGEGPGEGSGAAEPGTRGASEGAALPMGTVEGIVRLAAGEEPPRYATSGLSVGGPTPLPEECTPESAADREPMALAPDRGIASVPVIAMGDPTRWPDVGRPSTVNVRIHDCRLQPTVLTATVGDVLRIENDLVYPFFPGVSGVETGFTQAVLPGEPREVELDRARPMTLECTVTTGCRRAEILVLGHPVHTVSTEGGRFTLAVPADQDVELVAWHPLLRETSIHTRVAEGETVTVEITVSGLPPAEPTPPEPALPPGERPEDHPELGPF